MQKINVTITKTCLFKYIENFTSKNWKFSDKNANIFHISAQNIDYGYSPRRGGSNEYPQSMFVSRNKKNNVCPRKPQFYYKKVGFKGVKTIYMFSWWDQSFFNVIQNKLIIIILCRKKDKKSEKGK